MDSPSVLDRSPSVLDRSPSVMDRSPSVMDRSPSVVDRSPSAREGSPSSLDRSSPVPDRAAAGRTETGVPDGAAMCRGAGWTGRAGTRVGSVPLRGPEPEWKAGGRHRLEVSPGTMRFRDGRSLCPVQRRSAAVRGEKGPVPTPWRYP
ncbi:hypothetical protein [Streptomyces sp. NPDC127020]|uniref:hypothetical protein n=1 Tax=Streptomyces sp. NPDC127020 TaxID=3347109 RepID=UPI003655794F